MNEKSSTAISSESLRRILADEPSESLNYICQHAFIMDRGSKLWKRYYDWLIEVKKLPVEQARKQADIIYPSATFEFISPRQKRI